MCYLFEAVEILLDFLCQHWWMIKFWNVFHVSQPNFQVNVLHSGMDLYLSFPLLPTQVFLRSGLFHLKSTMNCVLFQCLPPANCHEGYFLSIFISLHILIFHFSHSYSLNLSQVMTEETASQMVVNLMSAGLSSIYFWILKIHTKEQHKINVTLVADHLSTSPIIP